MTIHNNNNIPMKKEKKNISFCRLFRIKLLLPLVIFGIVYQQYSSIRLSSLLNTSSSNNNNNELSIITTTIETQQQWISSNKRRRSLIPLQLSQNDTDNNNNNSNELLHKNESNNMNMTIQQNPFDGNTLTSKSIHTKGFGICLMLKEDNEILYEWLAYHYMTLPLIHLVVGSDINNPQNPYDVLKRWDIINDFSYTIMNLDDIIIKRNNNTNNNQYEIFEQNLYNKIIMKRNRIKKKRRTNLESDHDEGDEEEEENDQAQDEESDTEHDNNNINNNNNNNITLTSKEIHDIQVDLLVYRQNIFTNECMEHMIKNQYITNGNNIQQEIIWVTLIDTDEFLVLNRWDDTFDNSLTIIDPNNTTDPVSVKGKKTITKDMYQLRKYHLPNNTNDTLVTALDILQKLDNKSSSTEIMSNNHIIQQTIPKMPDIHIPTCYTMPRLWMSSIENDNDQQQCQQSIQSIKEWMNHTIPKRYQYMKTIRYFHHTGKNNLRLGLGKVMIRLSDFIKYHQNSNIASSTSTDSITDTTKKSKRRIQKKKTGNIHCPYTDLCNMKAIDITDSIFNILHYMGSWEQYSIQRPSDLRRVNNRNDYNNRAYMNRGSICHTNTEIYNWILYFQNHFIITMNATSTTNTNNNMSHIQYLLGY